MTILNLVIVSDWRMFSGKLFQSASAGHTPYMFPASEFGIMSLKRCT